MLAIDGSETSDVAIQEALKFIKNQHVKLRVLHVVDESIFYAGGPGFDYLSLIAELRKKGEGLLDEAIQKIESQSSVKVEKSLLELKPLQGRIAELIMEEATDWPADLLILGSHGRRGFRRFFLGSVAENVMRIATMPVLLVHTKSTQ